MIDQGKFAQNRSAMLEKTLMQKTRLGIYFPHKAFHMVPKEKSGELKSEETDSGFIYPNRFGWHI